MARAVARKRLAGFVLRESGGRSQIKHVVSGADHMLAVNLYGHRALSSQGREGPPADPSASAPGNIWNILT